MTIAFTFPGQGSQSVGMGKTLADAFASSRAVFEQVDDALGEKLSQLMWEGPMETLTLTANTQPALMACSLAVMAALKDEFDVDISDASYAAGHSLGEYSALCAAGSLPLEQTAKILRLRGEAMQRAVSPGEGAMAALLGASIEQAETIAKAGAAHGACQIANDNAVGQVVISGAKQAIEAAISAAKEMSIRKAVLLPVSAPFHCELMAPAADEMKEALADIELAAPVVPIVNNVNAAPISDPAVLKADLIAQVTGRVRWRESVQWLSEQGVDTLAEPGCGKVLSVMVRRIVKGLTAAPLNSPESLEAFAEQFKG